MRTHIKNSCFGFRQGLQTPRNNKSTRPKRPRAFICFSVFGTPDETLALVVDILHDYCLNANETYCALERPLAFCFALKRVRKRQLKLKMAYSVQPSQFVSNFLCPITMSLEVVLLGLVAGVYR